MNMKAYAFIVNMVDHASSGLQNIARSAGVADDRMEQLNKEAKKSSGVFGGLKGVLAGVFTVVALTTFTNRVIDARAEYEKFQAVLTNTFQSSDVGEGALNMLTDFAAKTPFALNELTGSFVKLVNRGFNPTMEQLTKMGDLAASQGKGFDQLTEAVLDAQTGEFERLKEFGIKASKAGGQITMSFKGVTKVIDDNEESLRNAVLQYGEMEGVAGAMAAISGTLGGKISNLGDRWNYFLVQVGGEGNGVLTGFIEGASNAIAFLTDHLPQISTFFEILWGSIKPVVFAVKDFIKAVFGIGDTSSVLDTFGAVMMGVLFVVDILSTGIVGLLDFLGPMAPLLGVLTALWWGFNIAVALSPVGWIVIGIMALIGVIGLVMKYTSGWGDSFKFTTEGMKLIMEVFVLHVKSQFTTMANGIMLGLDYIKKGWYNFKESIGLGDSAANQAALADLDKSIEARTQATADTYKEIASKSVEAASAFGITIDTDGMKRDFQAIKDKFSNLGGANNGDAAYVQWQKDQEKKKKLDYLAGNKTPLGSGKGKNGSKKGKLGGDTIVSGGTRKTNIYVTIQKLQDDTKIYVSSKEEGLKELGDKVQEVLLRSINSINQMQTG